VGGTGLLDRKIKLSDQNLIAAVKEMEQGRYEAALGGNVYKKRIALKGRGKSGSTRIIIAFKLNDRAFFIYGYSKGKRSNVTSKEKLSLKKLASIYFDFNRNKLNKAIQSGELREVVS